MQELPSSDALSVLSDEECEEHESADYQKRVRYPLPTMPLAIMVPVGHLPEYVAPVDAETVLSKTTGFDNSIDTLMETRERLATSYALFDDLCTSFRGPENLNRFLHSLVEPRSTTATPDVGFRDVTSPGWRSLSGARQIKGQPVRRLPLPFCVWRHPVLTDCIAAATYRVRNECGKEWYVIAAVIRFPSLSTNSLNSDETGPALKLSFDKVHPPLGHSITCN